MQIQNLLRQRLAVALAGMTDQAQEFSSLVRATQDPQFGDYQANCAMPLKQILGIPPREIAQQIVDHLDVDELCETPTIGGPGFINLRLRDQWIGEATTALLHDPRLGVDLPQPPRTIVVDFSSPNVAKPMHVGHIRSTVIGDALARTLRFLGHKVITDNHLGDWGTQFGLINFHAAQAGLGDARQATAKLQAEAEQAATAAASAEPTQAKKRKKAADGLARKATAAAAKAKAMEQKIAAVNADPRLASIAPQHRDIAQAVLSETVKLHQGDAENAALWHKFLPHCADEINRIYDRLGVDFDHTLGESFYHPMLADVVTELKASGVAQDSEGAVCVFVEGFEAPMIVQKKDGAYLYATTDLATLKYRQQAFQPDEILYVVDSRQADHFDKLFAVAPLIGLGQIRLVHVQFGTVLGEDGKPLKTRSGANAGLESLLDDAVAAAMEAVCSPERAAKLDPPLRDQEKQRIAGVIGHGAIKYADLAHHRASDYRLSLNKMVALEGNTIAYLEYAYARIQGILRTGQTPEAAVRERGTPIQPTEPAERALCLSLLRFPEALQQVADDYAPNALVDYLYDTARKYMVFNDNCHVLKAEDANVKASRLSLVATTGTVLRTGLSLLGIEVVERM